MISVASMIAVLALLIMGIFDYVWYNYRIFFLFWIVMAIGVACIKIGNRELERSMIVNENNAYSATADMDV